MLVIAICQRNALRFLRFITLSESEVLLFCAADALGNKCFQMRSANYSVFRFGGC